MCTKVTECCERPSATVPLTCDESEMADFLFFFFFKLGVTWELITLRQMMKVPNEPGLSVLFFDTKFRSSLADLAE